MSRKNSHPFAGKWQDLLQILGGSVILALFLFGCRAGLAAGPGSPTPAKQADITWTKTESPIFPASWPPTAKTVWVRYTFAYGRNLANLADGNYVTNPLSKTEWQAGSTSTTILNNEMTQAATQGVLPLDNETLKILENEKQISEYCQKLTGLPDPNTLEIKAMLAYYNAWFKYNGAFLGLIRADHAEFIDWVMQNK